ncbi:UNVERIFIED_CONTAM: ArsC family transcriptional regulator [Euhalothece sp. KZN 001]|jgi:protein-tyrosine-phosphatase
MGEEPTRIAFVCVENAGRSQMAAAFAMDALDGTSDRIEVLSGGTAPAEAVHPEVISVMQERGIDLTRHEPRAISKAQTGSADIVVTMGCSAEGVCPATWRGDSRDWDLPDPKGRDVEEVRAIRDRIEALVDELLAEVRPAVDGREV